MKVARGFGEASNISFVNEAISELCKVQMKSSCVIACREVSRRSSAALGFSHRLSVDTRIVRARC